MMHKETRGDGGMGKLFVTFFFPSPSSSPSSSPGMLTLNLYDMYTHTHTHTHTHTEKTVKRLETEEAGAHIQLLHFLFAQLI